MSATPVFEIAVPAPVAGSFTNGEKALAVHNPMGSTPALSTFYLARWLPVPAGLYVIKSYVDDAATWFAGVAMILSSQKSQGVFETFVFIPDDVARLDITLQNIQTSPSECFLAFSLWQQGRLVYASAGDGWYWDTAPIPDSALGGVSDPRRNLPVFAVLPNWGDGVIERLEWLTDVMTSETGNEMRRSLRAEPRRTLEAAFLRQADRRSTLDSFLTGVGQNRFLCPVWQEQYRPEPGIVAGSSTVQFPAGTLRDREFAANDLVIVMNKGPDQYDVLEVLSVNHTTDVLTWKVAPARDWPYGSRIIPLRICRIRDQATMSNPTDNVGRMSLRVTMDLPEQYIEPDWLNEGRVFPFRPNRATDIDLSYERITYTLDNETSVPSLVDLGGRAFIGNQMELQLRGRAQIADFRAWIGAARGRARRFYLPNFQQDVIPTEDLSGNQITTAPMGFYDYMKTPQQARIYICVVLHDGTLIYRRVVSITATGVLLPPHRVTSEVFILDQPFDAPIPLENIRRIQWVVPTRFNQDAFEILHHVDDAKVITVNVTTRSTDSAGMPDLIV